MKKIFITGCLFLMPLLLPAAGGVGCDYLRVAPPARTAAMSRAFAGVADDLSAIIYNPAGLINIKNLSLSFTHFTSFADTNYEYAAFALPLGGKIGTIGGSMLCDYTFDFDYYNEFGEKEGEVDNYDFVGTISYSYPLAGGIAAGVNFKVFYSKLYKYDKMGFALDMGAFFKLGKEPDTFAGLVIQNIGKQAAYIEIEDPLPINVKAGLGFSFDITEMGKLLVAADVNRLIKEGEELPTLDIGAEFVFFESLCIRGGYGFRHDTAGMSMGLGLNLKTVTFSYSYQPFDVLGAAHRISLDIELNDKK